MKSLYLALLILPALPLCAQRYGSDDQDQQQQQKPPTEIPDFTHLDEYIYQPKSNVTIGYRTIGGAKVSFWGNGNVLPPESVLNYQTPNIVRNYHDGTLSPDARTLTVDNGDGSTTTVPIPSDGKTNTWSYASSLQVTPDGYLQMHLYSASTLDSDIHNKTGKGNSGLELIATHDMKRFNKHLSWSVFAGLSINDIQAATAGYVKANVTTVTDTYNLFGQTAPGAPYQAPSSVSGTVVDSSGNNPTDSSGNAVSTTANTTVLLGNVPLNRSTSSAISSTSVIDNWKLHGAYATIRVGPSLVYNFNDHLKLSVSAGPALIYSGTTYTVNQVLLPPTGDAIVDEIQDTEAKLLPAYYADATLEYDFTDTAGLYLGSFAQGAGSYKQTSANSTGSYSTRVDFSTQSGLRTGMTFRF